MVAFGGVFGWHILSLCARYNERAAMGLTHIRVRLANPARPRRTVSVTFLVDSGAPYSVVPETVLRRLAIQPHSSRTFMLADGTEVTRRIGDATFQIDDQRAASPVIFGERGDSTLLGSVSLESLGMILDPMKRVLRPLPMVLGQHHT
jgi:clan AA aspartic protease